MGKGKRGHNFPAGLSPPHTGDRRSNSTRTHSFYRCCTSSYFGGGLPHRWCRRMFRTMTLKASQSVDAQSRRESEPHLSTARTPNSLRWRSLIVSLLLFAMSFRSWVIQRIAEQERIVSPDEWRKWIYQVRYDGIKARGVAAAAAPNYTLNHYFIMI